MMRGIRAALGCAALLLSGCSGEGDTPFSQTSEAGNLADRLRTPQARSVELPDLTPQFIDTLTTPTLLVTLEQSGTAAILSLYSERIDPEPGALRIWRSADGSQIVLREGVLVATRGLGNDIGSTQSSAMVDMLQSRQPASGLHRLYVVTGDNGTERIDLMCHMHVVGPETIEIVEQVMNTLHLRADCMQEEGAIIFEFWVDPVDSTVWQSRQWAGPSLGYLRTRLLKK